MRVIFCGHNERGSVCLNYLSAITEIEIALVVGHSKHDELSAYYKTIEADAKRVNLEYIAPKNINDRNVLNLIKNLKPDCIVLVGYSQCILKEELYDIPKFGTLNVHASLLPDYRGASPLNWALINGEERVGFSIIQIDEGIDTGPIIYQETLEIYPSDNISTVTASINNRVGPALVSVLGSIEERLQKKVTQCRSEGSFYSKRFPKDGRLNFRTMTSRQVINMVRALSEPYPGAFFSLSGHDYIVDYACETVENYKGLSGRVVKMIDADQIVVLCVDKAVCLKLRSPLRVGAKEAMKSGLDINDG